MATATITIEQILVAGQWRPGFASEHFASYNPATLQSREAHFPVSKWEDCQQALDAAVEAFWDLKERPASDVAHFLETFAAAMEQDKSVLVRIAHEETGLPVSPRLADVELPRTTNQLRQAAAAARSGSWALPTIDTKANIRSCYESIGPVIVFGPNNFPFAFNSIAGGDFAAAIAAGNPVIGKANSSHPETTKRLAELAFESAQQTKMPSALVQLIYRTSHQDGERLVSDPRVGATGYTGSRSAGLKLKRAADAAGKPIYLELSSVNPLLLLPGALRQRASVLVDEFISSALMGTGQFCTNPGFVLLVDSPETTEFIQAVRLRYESAAPGTLLSTSVQRSLTQGIQILTKAGAQLLTGGSEVGSRCAIGNTLMQATGQQFLRDPEIFQTEVFGNASLLVVCQDVEELKQVVAQLEGNLTGSIYSDSKGSDDRDVAQLMPLLAHRVGRLLNDKMPTGVAVSPAMNHGGPYPATGHPGFTAVGIPASLIRFAKLTCYDAVRPQRLPWLLRDTNPTGQTWRNIDGQWKVS